MLVFIFWVIFCSFSELFWIENFSHILQQKCIPEKGAHTCIGNSNYNVIYYLKKGISYCFINKNSISLLRENKFLLDSKWLKKRLFLQWPCLFKICIVTKPLLAKILPPLYNHRDKTLSLLNCNFNYYFDNVYMIFLLFIKIISCQDILFFK